MEDNKCISIDYINALFEKIKEIQGDESPVLKLIRPVFNKFTDSILYKSPEQLPDAFNYINFKIGTIIHDWIKENGGEESEFALSIREWIKNYFEDTKILV